MPPILPTPPRKPSRGPVIAGLALALLVCGGAIGAAGLFASVSSHGRAQVAAAAAAVPANDPFADISLTAKSAFVYDVKTGQILYAKNAETPMALASVTKVMMAIVAEEELGPDATVTITDSAIAQDGDSGLFAGEQWRMEDLLHFTLIMSSNDGAEALAEAAAKKIEAQFPEAPRDTPAAAAIWMMNRKAKELGLTQTFYVDSNGLDVSTSMAGAYGSARDIAVLFAYAIAHDASAFENTTNQTETFTSLSGYTHTAYATNESIGDIPGLIAGKTGFTDLAGGNLVIAFDSSIGHPVVVVALGSTEDGRFSDVEALAKAAREEIAQE
ncbi:MAG TPA: D-alanyl-D-alanine carboxypeptidase [Candidatus Paceibacterota bacterium]|nr:D-alanyl-D-alanine carboxypeptidase [Candidatus Paceibacterota bacterium]